MASLQAVRGTRDIMGDDWRRHRRVVETARAVAHRYAFEDVDTPVFEFTPVFARTMGEGSDVVRKEMYTFVDRGEEEVTLRPEYTAGICRALSRTAGSSTCRSSCSPPVRCSATSGRRRAGCASSTRSASSSWVPPSPWVMSR